MKDPKRGERVRHVPSKDSPRYHLVMGTGTIVAVTDTRVRVKWDAHKQARNYKAKQLESAEEMEVGA